MLAIKLVKRLKSRLIEDVRTYSKSVSPRGGEMDKPIVKVDIPIDILEDFLKGKESNLKNYLYYLTYHAKLPNLDNLKQYFIGY